MKDLFLIKVFDHINNNESIINKITNKDICMNDLNIVADYLNGENEYMLKEVEDMIILSRDKEEVISGYIYNSRKIINELVYTISLIKINQDVKFEIEEEKENIYNYGRIFENYKTDIKFQNDINFFRNEDDIICINGRSKNNEKLLMNELKLRLKEANAGLRSVNIIPKEVIISELSLMDELKLKFKETNAGLKHVVSYF